MNHEGTKDTKEEKKKIGEKKIRKEED